MGVIVVREVVTRGIVRKIPIQFKEVTAVVLLSGIG